MYTDYLFYLSSLIEVERNKQILTLILIWTIMLVIACIFEIVKLKKNKK